MKASDIKVGMVVERSLNVLHLRGGGLEISGPWYGGAVVAINYSGTRPDGSTYVGVKTQSPAEVGTDNGSHWSLDDEDLDLGKVRVQS